MSEQVAHAFIDALHRLEKDRDLEAIAATFTDDADVGNIIAPERFHGQEGAREFWSKYRETFGDMWSEFRNVITTDGRAALEWTTKGTTTQGHAVEYEGVSILEIAGDKITRFRAYFDTHSLSRQVVPESVAR